LRRTQGREVNTRNGVLPSITVEPQNEPMRALEFGEAVPAGTRLTLFSADKPDRLFTVITFCIDKVSGVALDLDTGVPCYQVEDEEGRIHLLIYLTLDNQNEGRWCLWRPDQADFDSRSIFDGALVEE
jgi:hypothetical protein